MRNDSNQQIWTGVVMPSWGMRKFWILDCRLDIKGHVSESKLSNPIAMLWRPTGFIRQTLTTTKR
jgi:hypothetical protein